MRLSVLQEEGLGTLEKRLETRINPERSRKFTPEHFHRSRELLARLGQEPWLVSSANRISVVGSNGKGSTAFFLSALLEQKYAGIKIGLYTSPHLLSPTERIRINSLPISAKKLNSVADHVDDLGGRQTADLSYFEYMTVLAMAAFRDAECEFEIYEAGLGGRLDATRMTAPETVVLTSIGLEHTELLGNDLLKIQEEKLGIIRKSVRNVFVYDDEKIPRDFTEKLIKEASPGANIYYFRGESQKSYLEENLQFARIVVEKTGYSAVDPNFRPPNPPGRLEFFISQSLPGNPTVVFDTAHNEQAIKKALDTWESGNHFSKLRTLVILASLADRNPASSVNLLESRGYKCRYILSDDDFHAPPDGAKTIYLSDDGEELALYCKENMPEAIIFLGTHRSYKYFQMIKEKNIIG